MIKTMPYESILDLAEEFDELFDPASEEKIPQWKCTDYVGMRKTPEATNLKDYRWLAKLNQFRQWYPKTWCDIWGLLSSEERVSTRLAWRSVRDNLQAALPRRGSPDPTWVLILVINPIDSTGIDILCHQNVVS